MQFPALIIRSLEKTDLDGVNAVISRCVMQWELPERVKRLALNSYLYHDIDLQHLDFVVAESPQGDILGVASWEDASDKDLPKDTSGMLLHGIYVDPAHQKTGVGTALLEQVMARMRQLQVDGLLAKAQASANPFFAARGFHLLPVLDSLRDYPHRWWKPVAD
jgi:N-acetylglutamate synthase-like GNAT family acetyltransferase